MGNDHDFRGAGVCRPVAGPRLVSNRTWMQFHQFHHRSEAVVPVSGQVDDKGQPKRAGQVWHDTPDFRTDYDGSPLHHRELSPCPRGITTCSMAGLSFPIARA